MAEYDTSTPAHDHFPENLFVRIVDTHLTRTGNRGGFVGRSPSFLIDARALLRFALEVMVAVAADPSALDRWCPPIPPVRPSG
jgi:hypothetical protein